MLLEGVEDTYSFTGTFHGVVLPNKSQQVKKMTFVDESS